MSRATGSQGSQGAGRAQGRQGIRRAEGVSLKLKRFFPIGGALDSTNPHGKPKSTAETTEPEGGSGGDWGSPLCLWHTFHGIFV